MVRVLFHVHEIRCNITFKQDPTGEEVSDYDEEYTTPDVLPVFTSKEQHFSVEEGGDITFPCQVENQGAHVVMFKHIHPDGEHRLLFVGAETNFKLTKNGNSFKLGRRGSPLELRVPHRDLAAIEVPTPDVHPGAKGSPGGWGMWGGDGKGGIELGRFLQDFGHLFRSFETTRHKPPLLKSSPASFGHVPPKKGSATTRPSFPKSHLQATP
ncbi:hypothetical protein GWK47_041453 [Chionoecetes opilio]|uniref:Uncharacterized protein n=1 Tax=Chionoecetes opilio TaxID=41210 RepID=A0A8J4YH14_CHIOP|nr:hypothetical protein GWK47_041453 [Chionoecetes opilio]